MRPDDPQLRMGRMFESEFERLIRRHRPDLIVIRYCDQLGVNGVKAPMASGEFAGFRLPDFGIIDPGIEEYWAEVKYKARSPFYGVAGCKRHGIDLPNWRDYLKVCEITRRRGFLIIGEGETGEILIAPFDRLERHAQIRRRRDAIFSQGAVFWPRDIFKSWGRFDRRNGQMEFHFDFRDDIEWRRTSQC